MSILNKLFNKKNETKVEIKDTDSLKDVAIKLAKADIISVPKDNSHNSFGDNIDKLINGELPWGWVHAKKDFIIPRDHKLTELSINASNTDDIDIEIELLREFVSFFEKYKNECKLKGECYEKYFYNMNIHDGSDDKKPDYYWLNKNKERLKYLEKNRNILIAERQKKADELKDLSRKLKYIIINNQGVLQSDIYNQFDEIIKNEISNQLYSWAKDGKIRREKSGKTYKIYFNQ